MVSFNRFLTNARALFHDYHYHVLHITLDQYITDTIVIDASERLGPRSQYCFR